MCCLGIDAQFPAVEPQENIGAEKGHALVAVHEGVVEEQSLEQRCGHPVESLVVAGLRAVEGAHQQPAVTNTRGAATVSQLDLYLTK